MVTPKYKSLTDVIQDGPNKGRQIIQLYYDAKYMDLLELMESGEWQTTELNLEDIRKKAMASLRTLSIVDDELDYQDDHE